MTIALVVLGIIAVLYIAFVEWRRSLPREIYYDTFWSPLFLKVTNHMQATTLWNLTLMLESPTAQLSASGLVHENTHVAQWARQPYTFAFRYLWENWRHGYGCNIYEEAARLAAGEASECHK